MRAKRFRASSVILRSMRWRWPRTKTGRPVRCVAGIGAQQDPSGTGAKCVVRWWLYRRTLCARREGHSWASTCHRADCQALDCRTQLRLVGKKMVMEKLRTQTQRQFAIHPSCILGIAPQKIVNRFLGYGSRTDYEKARLHLLKTLNLPLVTSKGKSLHSAIALRGTPT